MGAELPPTAVLRETPPHANHCCRGRPLPLNKTLSRLGQIIDVAEERELIARNPMRVNGRRRKLRTPNTRRSYIDRQSTSTRSSLPPASSTVRLAPTPRRAILATLALAGLRIGELLELRWCNIDLASGALHVGRSKTDAGIREIALLPFLCNELAALKAARNPAIGDLVFGTNPRNPAECHQHTPARPPPRGDASQRDAGNDWCTAAPGPAHTALATANVCVAPVALGRSAPAVMAQLGRTDARLTLRV